MPNIESTIRIDTNILDNFLRVRIDTGKRKSVAFQEADRRQRISYNNGGKTCEWRVTAKHVTPTAGLGTAVQIAFPQTPTKKVMSIPWRRYHLGESVSYYEQLLSKHRETALFDIVEEVTRGRADDFLRHFRTLFYGDGNAGVGADLHGFDSFTAYTGLVSGSPVGNPTDTYAGKSTALGQSGDWPAATGYWPAGVGDAEYCWNSPVLCDVNNSRFTGYASGIKSTWQQAIRFVTTFASALQEQEFDLLVVCSNWYNLMRDSLDDHQRFVASERPANVDVGYKFLDFEGLKIAHEYGCPANSGYFWSFDNFELRCLTSQLIEMQEDTDIRAGGERLYAFQFYGNAIFWAGSFFAKLVEITALGT